MCARVLLLVLVFVMVLAWRTTVARAEEDTSLSKKPASRLVRPFVYNAKDAWQTFLKNAEREEKKAKKQRNRLRNARLRQMQTGLPGPRGPRGPPGPPGGQMTKEELVKEFREMVREAAEKRFQITVDPQCAKEYSGVQKSESEDGPPLLDAGHVTITPKVSWSFLWQLREDRWIGSGSIDEISNYYKPSAKGSHDRCQSFVTAEQSFDCQNSSWTNSGRYEPQKSGFYTFYVSFHLNKNSSCDTRPQDSIQVLLCINSSCEENVSLRTMTDVKNSPFTVSINGILHLKKKQYVSVYVNNNSECSLRILRNSQLAGFLTGF